MTDQARGNGKLPRAAFISVRSLFIIGESWIWQNGRPGASRTPGGPRTARPTTEIKNREDFAVDDLEIVILNVFHQISEVGSFVFAVLIDNYRQGSYRTGNSDIKHIGIIYGIADVIIHRSKDIFFVNLLSIHWCH